MSGLALIAEPSVPVSGALKKYLEGAGFSVKIARTAEEALLLAQGEVPGVLFAASGGGLDGAALCQKVKHLSPSWAVVLLYPPDVEEPDTEVARAGADACLVGPLKRGTVVSCARTMVRLRSLLEQVVRLETDLKQRSAERKGEGEGASGSGDFDFFKRLLLMEVKRSRRYRYPVAFLLVGLDRFTEHVQQLSSAERTRVLAEALRLISRGVRDIDLAVPFSEGRYLVFLPHTPRDGALVVATRVRERLARMEGIKGLTASVGVAAYEPGSKESQVSFGSLMKEATEALRKAQLAGGDRVDAGGEKARRDRISLG